MPDLSDRDALVCMFEYLRGQDRWYNNTFWNSERPCGKWFGVTVDEGAHVKSLVLSDNRLDGFFFENTRFSSLRNVKVLWLNNNLIRGTIPHCFGTYMVALEELNLSWNLFTGEMNFHSKQEYVSVQDMEKAMAVLVELVKLWVE